MRPALALSAAAFLTAAAVATPARLDAIRLDDRVEFAREIFQSDLEGWAGYGFRRRVVREAIDRRGEVSSRAETLFAIRPREDGFDETLLWIDGRKPSRAEVKEHREAGRFQQHYRAALEARLDVPVLEDLPLSALLFDQVHLDGGADEIDGIPCRWIRFEPDPEPRGGSVNERLMAAAAGSFCLAEAGHHIVRARVRSVRGVGGAMLGLGGLELAYEARPLGSDWLPRGLDVRTEVNVGGRTIRKRNRYRYDAFYRTDD